MVTHLDNRDGKSRMTLVIRCWTFKVRYARLFIRYAIMHFFYFFIEQYSHNLYRIALKFGLSSNKMQIRCKFKIIILIPKVWLFGVKFSATPKKGRKLILGTIKYFIIIIIIFILLNNFTTVPVVDVKLNFFAECQCPLYFASGTNRANSCEMLRLYSRFCSIFPRMKASKCWN
jgi:hypothetical protein